MPFTQYKTKNDLDYVLLSSVPKEHNVLALENRTLHHYNGKGDQNIHIYLK